MFQLIGVARKKELNFLLSNNNANLGALRPSMHFFTSSFVFWIRLVYTVLSTLTVSSWIPKALFPCMVCAVHSSTLCEDFSRTSSTRLLARQKSVKR